MKLKIILCTLMASTCCFAETTNLIYLENPSAEARSRPANDSTSTIVLTRPIHDVSWTAGTKASINFQSENNSNSVEVRLVKSLGNGAVDMSVQYPVGEATNVKAFGKNKAVLHIGPDIPPGDYGVFLFATNIMTGAPLNSVSSPTIHLRSSIFHPGPGAVVRKGKEYVIRWKSLASLGADGFTVYFQGDVTTDRIELGTVSSGKNSVRVSIPELPDTEGMFILAGNGAEVQGNMFHVK